MGLKGFEQKGNCCLASDNSIVGIFINTLFEGVYKPSRYLEVSSEQYDFFKCPFLYILQHNLS